MTHHTDAWVGWERRSGCAAITAFCVPHAGASAAVYRSWARGLAEDIDLVAIELPGRWGRWSEAPWTSLPTLCDAIAEAVRDSRPGKFVLLGYSFGALVAYEVARRLSDAPAALVVVAARAPDLERRRPHLHELDDAAFIAAVQRKYGPLPPPVLADEDMLAIVRRALRADLSMLERYQHEPRSAFDFPIYAFGGRADPATDVDALRAWSRHTSGKFDLALFEGGHFFVEGDAAAFFPALTNVLYSIAGRSRSSRDVELSNPSDR